ncbi:MAG: hypothetical protein ACTTK0_07485 [Stomatobaculum sp.]
MPTQETDPQGSVSFDLWEMAAHRRGWKRGAKRGATENVAGSLAGKT